MASKPGSTALATVAPDIDTLIVEVRGQKVILDADLAGVYGVPTKALNQAVKRNGDKFPADFMFRLSNDEVVEITRSRSQSVALNKPGNRSQLVTGSQKHRDPRHPPYVFTEHGAIMAANVLNSPSAAQISVFVVRAFVKMRTVLTDTRELARKLAET